jgi:hypothetical protein
MKIELYSQVALSQDIPDHNLKKGDVATIVEQIPPESLEPKAYVLEVFNVLGDSVDVLIVPESSVESLRPDELWAIRPMAQAA